MLKWEENLARYVASRYISMPIVKDSIGPSGTVMDPLCIDAVEGYVRAILGLIHRTEDFVEAVFLATFLWSEQTIVTKDGAEPVVITRYASHILIGFTVACCWSVAQFSHKHVHLHQAKMVQTSRVRYDFVFHRAQMNLLSDSGSKYRQHYAFHVSKVHVAIHDFFAAKHAFLNVLIIEKLVYQILDRVVVITPLLLFHTPLSHLCCCAIL